MKRAYIVKLMVFFICICIIMSAGSYAVAAMPQKNDLECLTAAEHFAQGVIHDFIETKDKIVTWTDSTAISSSKLLYNPYGDINGVIFHMKTKEQPNGFIQVGFVEDYWYVVNLGFDGDDFLTGLITYNKNAGRDILVKPDQKIYYIGGYSYYTYNDEGDLLSLEDGTVSKKSLEALQPSYDEFCSRLLDIPNEPEIVEGTNTSTFYHVTGWSDASTYMRTTDYYVSLNSSLHDHCSPTAATNLVMYWKYGRNFFPNNSSSQETVFNWFYSQMETNIGQTGTSWSNIQSPIAIFFAAYSGASSDPTGIESSVTFNKIKTKCNSDIPLQLEVINYSNNKNHSVNVWGYNINSNVNYLFMTNNWGTNGGYYVSFSLMNYSAYSYGQFVYTNPSM